MMLDCEILEETRSFDTKGVLCCWCAFLSDAALPLLYTWVSGERPARSRAEKDGIAGDTAGTGGSD